MWPPRSPLPTKPSRSDRQRPGETAGERRRGRRTGAGVPTLTGPDFVLTSGAQVAPTRGAVDGGPRRASGARASAAVGAMSFLDLRSRSSCCHRLGAERPPVHAPTRRRPATLPPQSRRASDPAKAGIQGGGAGCPHPVAQRPPAQQTRKGGPHARRWTQTRPCWRSCNVPPPGATPLLAYLRKTPPGPTDPARDPDRSQSKENHPTASARAPPPGNNCCFTPRPASKDDKKHKAILQREINHTALLLTEAAKLFNDATPQPSPTKPSR